MSRTERDDDGGQEERLPRRQSGNLTFVKEPLRVRFQKVKRKFLYASSPSDSLANPSSVGSSNGSNPQQQRQDQAQANDDDDQDWTVDKVVVDGDFGGPVASSHRESQRDTSGFGNQEIDPSELADSLMRVHRGIRSCGDMYSFLRVRASEFFDPKFADEETERQFLKEQWYNNKFLAWYVRFSHEAPLSADLVRLIGWPRFSSSSIGSCISFRIPAEASTRRLHT